MSLQNSKICLATAKLGKRQRESKNDSSLSASLCGLSKKNLHDKEPARVVSQPSINKSDSYINSDSGLSSNAAIFNISNEGKCVENSNSQELICNAQNGSDKTNQNCSDLIYSEDLVNNNKVCCYVCGLDITKQDVHSQNIHINNCLDSCNNSSSNGLDQSSSTASFLTSKPKSQINRKKQGKKPEKFVVIKRHENSDSTSELANANAAETPMNLDDFIEFPAPSNRGVHSKCDIDIEKNKENNHVIFHNIDINSDEKNHHQIANTKESLQDTNTNNKIVSGMKLMDNRSKNSSNLSLSNNSNNNNNIDEMTLRLQLGEIEQRVAELQTTQRTIMKTLRRLGINRRRKLLGLSTIDSIESRDAKDVMTLLFSPLRLSKSYYHDNNDNVVQNKSRICPLWTLSQQQQNFDEILSVSSINDCTVSSNAITADTLPRGVMNNLSSSTCYPHNALVEDLHSIAQEDDDLERGLPQASAPMEETRVDNSIGNYTDRCNYDNNNKMVENQQYKDDIALSQLAFLLEEVSASGQNTSKRMENNVNNTTEDHDVLTADKLISLTSSGKISHTDMMPSCMSTSTKNEIRHSTECTNTLMMRIKDTIENVRKWISNQQYDNGKLSAVSEGLGYCATLDEDLDTIFKSSQLNMACSKGDIRESEVSISRENVTYVDSMTQYDCEDYIPTPLLGVDAVCSDVEEQRNNHENRNNSILTNTMFCSSPNLPTSTYSTVPLQPSSHTSIRSICPYDEDDVNSVEPNHLPLTDQVAREVIEIMESPVPWQTVEERCPPPISDMQPVFDFSNILLNSPALITSQPLRNLHHEQQRHRSQKSSETVWDADVNGFEYEAPPSPAHHDVSRSPSESQRTRRRTSLVEVFGGCVTHYSPPLQQSATPSSQDSISRQAPTASLKTTLSSNLPTDIVDLCIDNEEDEDGYESSGSDSDSQASFDWDYTNDYSNDSVRDNNEEMKKNENEQLDIRDDVSGLMIDLRNGSFHLSQSNSPPETERSPCFQHVHNESIMNDNVNIPANSNVSSAKDIVQAFIKSHTDLYNDVLCFKPLNLNILHQRLSESSIKISKTKLLETLDALAVFVSCGGPKRKRRKDK